MTQEAINTPEKAILHLAILNLELARTNRRLVERNVELADKMMKLRGQRGWLIRQCRYLDKKLKGKVVEVET